MGGRKSSLVAILVVVALAGCVSPQPKSGSMCKPPKDPRLLDALRAGGLEAFSLESMKILAEHEGEPFPDLRLSRSTGNPLSLSSFSGTDLILLVLIPHIMKEDAFREYDALTWDGSTLRASDDRRVIVVVYTDHDRASRRLLKRPGVYRVARPFPGYLDYLLLFPSALAIDGSFRYRGLTELPRKIKSRTDDAAEIPQDAS